MKSGFDSDALVDQFATASAQQTEQLRHAVYDATMRALQGRELSLANIRKAIAAVTAAASTGAARNPGVDVEAMLDQAVAGMDEAVLKAVEANRIALQQLVERGVDIRETHLKKALADMDKFEDTLLGAIRKGAGAAGDPLAGPWGEVLKKFESGAGTQTGAGAANATEQLAAQMHSAMRESRAAGMKAVQALAESYTALVSGVLIGMSDAIREGGAARPAAKAAKK